MMWIPIMFPCLFSVYMDGVMKEVKMGMRKCEDFQVPCKQITWFYVVSWKKT